VVVSKRKKKREAAMFTDRLPFNLPPGEEDKIDFYT
jgi:hypothetical protein